MPDRSHTWVRAALPDYLAGHLTLADREDVERHLTTCHDCRKVLYEWRAIERAVGDVHEAILPIPDVVERAWMSVQARIASQDNFQPKGAQTMQLIDDSPIVPPATQKTPANQRRRAFLPVAAALVTIVLVAVLLGFRNHQASHSTVVRPPASAIVYVTSYVEDQQKFVAGEPVPFRVTAVDIHSGKALWHFDGIYSTVLSYATPVPVVAGGTVYIATDDVSDPKHLSGYLYALDAKDGSQLWRYPIGFGASATPIAVSNGIVLTRSYDAITGDHAIVALSAQTGALLWRTPISGFFDVLTLASGTVYVATSTPAGSIIIEPGYVLKLTSDLNLIISALDVRSGIVLWHNTYNGYNASEPIVANGFVYVFNYAEQPPLLALDPGTGDVRWSFPKNIITAPIVAGSTIFLADFPNCIFCPIEPPLPNPPVVYALDAVSGHLLWSNQFKQLSTIADFTPTSQDNLLVVIDNQALVELSGHSGKQDWQQSAPGASQWQSVADAGGVAYASNYTINDLTTGEIVALDDRDGQQRWSIQVNIGMPAVQLIAGNAVYISGAANINDTQATMQALRASDGATLWQAAFDGRISSVTPGA